jgi:multiple sugar transport system substrate-binding protein
MSKNLIQSGVTCVVICLLLIVPLSGCGGGAMPTPEPVAIVFAHSGSDAEYYEALVQEFNERYPHITVEVRPRRSFQPFQQTNPDADVFVGSSFNLNELREEGDVLSLEPFIEQDVAFDLSDFYPGTVEAFTSEGRVWAIPAGMDMLVMFYNQDLFDQYDVPYPEAGWTWGDFLDTALALRDPEASVFGYAPTDRIYDAVSFIYQHGGRLFDDLQNPTRPTFDDPLTIEALEWYAKLIREYNVAPTQMQLYDEDLGGAGSAVVGVYLNKIGMWTGWLSERGGGRGSETWPGEWKMRWGVAPLPRDAQSATLMSVEGYFVSSQAQHPDACWQWISFLSEQMSSDARYPRRLMPARKSLAESAAYEQQVGSDVATVARASMESAMLPSSPRLVEFGGVWGIFWRALDEIIGGRSTPEEAMISAQQEAERIVP